MRHVIGTTFVALSALALQGIGCASEVDTTPFQDTSGGEGGATSGTGTNTGSGGQGGEACVPADETCGNAIDDDCDGEVDEDCECASGDMQECYPGPRGTKGVGLCTAGAQTCDVSTFTFGVCVGAVLPQPAETCDGEDSDCNGQVDDGISPIGCGVGACLVTVPGCVDGQVPACAPGSPSFEICDGLDNDCDQLTDEAFLNQGAVCDSGIPGACAAGTFQCLAGVETCVPGGMAGGEICDGIDNDCDGTVDNNIPGTGGACSSGYPGVCSAGTISCQGGVIDCFPITAASPELCDSLDNDCDSQTDNGNPGGGGACVTGQPGVCSAGTENCIGGAISCTPNNLGAPEVCNGQDDDCDNQIDNGNPGGGVPCGCGGTTACVNGATACQGGPTTYFSEGFANNNAGWTLGTEWQIGPAVAGPAGNCADPGTDTTATADNGIAGVIIGGCSTSSVSKTLHGYYYLTSPVIDTAAAAAVVLSFKRWLRSDYTPYMNNVIEVYNGSVWTVIWQSGGTGIADASWQTITHTLTAYKSANMQIRWGFNVGSSGVFSEGSWNVDDVLVASTACP